MRRHAVCWSFAVVCLMSGCSSSGGPTVPPVPEGASAAPTKAAAPAGKEKGGAGTLAPTAKINE